MNKSAIVFIILICANVQLASQVNRIMTYNIRYDNLNDGVDQWANRKSEVIDFLKYYEPDLLGIQEGLLNQVQYLSNHLPGYAMIGVGRDDGVDRGEYSSIFYNKEKLSLIEASTFWLSETSHKVSVGWDASMERICTYGLFEAKNTKERILVLNTHFDHIGKVARAESAKLILKKIRELNIVSYPVVLMGDFNAQPEDEPIAILTQELEDGSSIAKGGIYGPEGTFTGFKKDLIPTRRLDYIFTKGLEVMKYRHIDDRMKNSNYLSDHLPVLIKFN